MQHSPAAAPIAVTLSINGREQTVLVEPRRTLLDVLRHDLELTGTKKVCDVGNCGACTVVVDGQTMYSCLLLAVDCDGREILTIEGLADGNQLTPLQQAFIDEDAFQCGFCTSGQIMSLHALLEQSPGASEDEIRTAVTGNLCRCGAYPNIVKAALRVAGAQDGTPAAADGSRAMGGG
jgi:xanthine dehydrogenase YagT iron-sulfur-binding subunit